MLTQQNIVLLSNDPHTTKPTTSTLQNTERDWASVHSASTSELHALLHVADKSTHCAVMFRLRNISQEGAL